VLFADFLREKRATVDWGGWEGELRLKAVSAGVSKAVAVVSLYLML
jgi:hypothetical protein